jgi:hypothetical protein
MGSENSPLVIISTYPLTTSYLLLFLGFFPSKYPCHHPPPPPLFLPFFFFKKKKTNLETRGWMGWNLEVIRHLQLGCEFGVTVDLRVVLSKEL